MQLGEISFCDKIGYNIRSDELKAKILKELEIDYGFKVIQKHYDIFLKDNHIQVLNKNPHLICTRSNGNPYLLYLTKINFINQCIFIDKKIQQGYHYPRMIVAKLWFDDILFNNTLFDGEMIKDNDGNWLYLIGDLIADSGKMLQNQNLVKRINRVYNILNENYVEDTINLCSIKVKKYFTYDNIDKIDEFITKLNYTIRGIYFKPLFLKFKDILYNFNNDLIIKVKRYKYKEKSLFLTEINGNKEIEKNIESESKNNNEDIKNQKSVNIQENVKNQEEKDFYVMKTTKADIYNIFDDNIMVGIALCNQLATSRLLTKIFENTGPNIKIKMKCVYNSKFQKWQPVHQCLEV